MFRCRRHAGLVNSSTCKAEIYLVRCAATSCPSAKWRQPRDRFYVVNPTSAGYDFVWESQGIPQPAWRCGTQRGMILAGKRGEMVFDFTPDDMDTSEVGFATRPPACSLMQQGDVVAFICITHLCAQEQDNFPPFQLASPSCDLTIA